MKFISEKTLYNYIFCPKALSEEERLYLLENIEKFNKDLELLRAIKSSIENELPDTVLDKIHKKIIKASAQEGIKLDLVHHSHHNHRHTFAADSVQNEFEQKTCSYIDESKNFIIKIINKDAISKIYIFTAGGLEDVEYSLTFFPSKEVYYVNSEDIPLIVSPQQLIKSIILKTY